MAAWLLTILESLKLINTILPRILAWYDLRIAAQIAADKRIKDAETAEADAKRRCTENAYNMGKANHAAAQLLWDDQWKTRYQQILDLLLEGKTSEVLATFVLKVNYPPVNAILFPDPSSLDALKTPEIKAMEMVEIMRNTLDT